MANIPSDTARTVLLNHFPRVLRAGLDTHGRRGSAARQLVLDAGSLSPRLGAGAKSWLDAQSGHMPEAVRPRLMSKLRSLIRPSAVYRTAEPIELLLRTIDALAARSDDPSIHGIGDALLLLGRPTDVRHHYGRLAESVWSCIDHLPETGATLHQLALVSSGAQEFGEDSFPFEALPSMPDGLTDPATALSNWREALDLAFEGLAAESRTLALGLASLDVGHAPPYGGRDTLGALASALGWVLVEPLERNAVILERQQVARILAQREADSKRREAATQVQPAQPVVEAVPAGHVVVCARVSANGAGKGKDVVRGHEHVIGVPLPLIPLCDVAAARSRLVAEFPYAAEAVDSVLGSFAWKTHAHADPLLLEGPPGAGKSFFARRLGEVLGVGVYRVDGSNDSGASFGGTERRWYSAEPSRPFQAVSRFSRPNPIILVDEIDKAPTRSEYGRLWDSILPALEKETAARFPDPCLQADIDVSWVTIVCTANEAWKLPAPLLDRLRIVRFPAAAPSDLVDLLPSVLTAIAAERGMDPRFLPALDRVELSAVRERWRGGSVRRLRRIVEAILRAREHLAMRTVQ